MSKVINKFYDLDAWQKVHKLVLKVYKITNQFSESENYGVRSQIQRAVTSITANIAEGFARFYFKDKIRFYYQARGSAAEVQNFLLIARDLKYIDNNQCAELGEIANETAKLINGLIRITKKYNKN